MQLSPEPLKLSLVSLELFPDYEPSRPETEERIYERIRSMQERYDNQTWYRLLEDGILGKSRMAEDLDFYPSIKEGFMYGKVFLDAGTGMGPEVRRAIRDGIEPGKAIGLTRDSREIAWGKEFYGDDNDPGHSGVYIVSDARKMGIRSESVDYLNNNSLINVIGGKENVLAFLGEAARVLRPGGLFFGMAPGGFKEEMEPHYNISKDAMETYLHRLGFRNIDINVYELPELITFRYVSGKFRSEKPTESPHSVTLHFIARKR